MLDSVPDSSPETESDPPVSQSVDPATGSVPDNEEQSEPSETKTFAFNISVKEVIRLHTTSAEDAIVQEMDQLFKDKRVLVPILRVNSKGRNTPGCCY